MHSNVHKRTPEDSRHPAHPCPAVSPQGVTFRVEKDDLVIARILHGGMIDRQGLLHVGDIIKEVNGKDVGNNPTELQEMLKDCSGGITLKILPSYRDAPAPPQVHTNKYTHRNAQGDANMHTGNHKNTDTNTPPYVTVADVGRWYGAGDVSHGHPTIPCTGM